MRGFPPGSVFAAAEEFHAYIRRLKASVEGLCPGFAALR
jgi:hypothetical protein